LFNHIPKTGGTSMRIILNKVYGMDKVFFINSCDISGSLLDYKNLDSSERKKFKVVSGHGAEMFCEMLENPFRLGILREPVSLFLSQYSYLKKSPNSNFRQEVSALGSKEAYLDYAIKNGQDNLLCRYFSSSMRWLADPGLPIPDMEKQGDELLEKAKAGLHTYDALIDLSRFDQGIYFLARKLRWPRIPLYRPSNISEKGKNQNVLSDGFLQQLKDILRWDILLYQYFLQQKLDISITEMPKDRTFQGFLLRQKGIALIARLLGKT
jgi:Sulfotransferase family